MIGILLWLVQALVWTLIVVHAVGFVTALRARRWVRAAGVEWSGVSEAVAAQVVADHLAAVQDDFFAFPTGTFAAHPSRHRPRDGVIVMVEQYPDDRAAFSGVLDVTDVLIGTLELAEGLSTIPRTIAKVVGTFGGGYYGAVWLGGSSDIALNLGSVTGAIIGALAGWLAGIVVGWLIAAVIMLALLVLGVAMLPFVYLLLRVHRAAFRSRIEGRVKAGPRTNDVSIELRFRGLSAYAVQRHVTSGVGPPRLHPADGSDFKHDPGLRRVGRLGFDALASSVLLTVLGFFVIV
jgi:hypothetical protein